MDKKAIIKGKVVRLAKYDDTVEFSVDTRETNIFGHLFTIGDVVECKVHARKSDDFIIIKGHVMNPQIAPGEKFETASRLALNDKVTVEFSKNEDGSWKVISIIQEAKRGRPVGEYLDDMAKTLEERREKHLQSYA